MRALGAAAGAVISASHNPFADNGIKFFGPEGVKLPEETEDEIEALLGCAASLARATGPAVGRLRPAEPAQVDAYVNHTVASARGGLSGWRMVLDCANGATTGFGRQVFERLGADRG